MILARKRNFADVVELKILDWGDYPELLGSTKITRVLQEKSSRFRVNGRDIEARANEYRWPLEAENQDIKQILP